MDNETRDIVKGILKSWSVIASNGAKRSMMKIQKVSEQAERDKKEYEARQNEIAQRVWVDTYTQETAPALAELIAEALNAVLHINISDLNVSCDFSHCDTSNAFVWNIECAVGSAYDTEKIDSNIFRRHMNSILKNIHRKAHKDFEAFFCNASHMALNDGYVIRYDYFRRNCLRLWQAKVVGVKASLGVVSMTVHLLEMPQVAYFANQI